MAKAAFILTFLLGSAALAQEITPRWKLEPGKTRRFRQTVKVVNEPRRGLVPQPSTQIDMTCEFTQKILKKDAAGLATLEMRFEKIKQQFKNPMESFGFDSEKPGDLERARAHPHLKQAANIIGKSLTAVVDARGVVHSMTHAPGSEDLSFSEGDLQQMLLKFPERALSTGDKWTVTTKHDMGGLPMSTENNYTVKRVEGPPGARMAVLGCNSMIKLLSEKAKTPESRNLRMKDFKGSGTVTFALDEGVLKSIETSNEYVVTFASNAPGQPEGLVQSIKTKTTVELIPDGK
jgi:hypothetical protein